MRVIYLSFICTLFFVLSDSIDYSEDVLKKYLLDKSHYVHMGVEESGRTNTIIETSIEYENTFSRKIRGNYTNVFAFTVLDNMLLILDDKILVNGLNNSFKLVDHSSFPEGKIKFVKALDYLAFGVLAVTYENGITYFYLFTSPSEYTFAHSVYHVKPSDAKFFINDEKLYLLIIDQLGDDISSILTYVWTGTHFDQTQRFFVRNIVAMNSFSWEDSEIIILAQHSGPSWIAVVFEFKNDVMRKTQYLKIHQPVSIVPYRSQNEDYVVIFSEDIYILYLWSGSELLKWTDYKPQHKNYKAMILASQNTTAILTIEENTLVTYDVTDTGFRILDDRVHNLKVEDPQNIRSFIFKNFILFIEDSHKNELEVRITPFTLDSTVKTENVVQEKSDLLNRLSKLMKRTQSARSDILKLRKNRDVNVDEIVGDIPDLLVGMKKELDILKMRIKRVDDIKNEYKNNPNELVLYGNNVINGTVTGNHLTAHNIIFQHLKDKIWSPQKWLCYKKPQIITGPVTASMVSTKLLKTNDMLFTKILSRDGDQEISGDARISKLAASKIGANNINNINVNNIYLKDKPTVIKGTKTFSDLAVRDVVIERLNGEDFEEYSMLPFVGFSDHLFVENLFVENIDGINWNDFKKSFFIRGQSHKIEGPLTFNKIQANTLQVEYLNDNKVSELLTTSENQTINSFIHCYNLYARNSTVGKINGIVLEKEAVFVNEANGLYLKGQIHMENIEAENIFVKGQTRKDLLKGVSPTDASSLQMYHGKIKVKGDVYVKNIKFAGDPIIIINNQSIPSTILDRYWTKNTPQNIPVYFEAQKGIKVSHLTLLELNTVPVKNYMSNNFDSKGVTRFYFENARIMGNVYLKSGERHHPDLEDLKKTSVKLSGTYQIKSKKIFRNSLKVGSLEVEEADDFIENEIARLPVLEEKDFSRITNITVTGNLTCDNLSTNSINGVDLLLLQNETLYNDIGHELESLELKHVTSDSLFVSQWNGFNMSDFMTSGMKINYVKNIIVNGDVILKNVAKLEKINGHDTNELLKNVLEFSGGKLKNVIFRGVTTVTNFCAGLINNVQIPKLLDELVYTDTDQNITGHWTLERLVTDDLTVKHINNVSTDYLIDVNKQENQIIKVKNGLVFNAPVTIKSLYLGHINNTMSEADMFYGQSKIWPSLIVEGHVTFLDESSAIALLFKNAACATEDIEIFLPIIFTSDIRARNVHTNHTINGVNLTHLANDALYKYGDDIQIISGHIKFNELVASYTDIAGNLDTLVINRIDIPYLNKSIIRKGSGSYFIRGNKTFFSGLQCQKFIVINEDDEFKHIVDQFNLKPIPEVTFDTVHVTEDLNIKYVQDFNLNSVLKNRMLTHGAEQVVSGSFSFDSIETRDVLMVSGINDVPATSIIFDYDIQNIQSPKTFTKELRINGSMTVHYVNGAELSKVYENALLKDEDAKIQGNIIIMKPSQMIGNIQTDEINGVSFYNITNIMRNKTNIFMTQRTEDAVNQMHDMAKTCIKMIDSLQNEYMYMEKSADLQLAIPNVLHAQAVSIKGFILIHVIKEENGLFCHLPDHCTCEAQDTIQITPHNSVASFNNKDYRRVYSFDDEKATYHFITNSTSHDESCRQDSERVTSETSMLTWNTVPTKTNSGGFYVYQQHYSGYISGVEYFTIKNCTFIVIGRFYDPIYNSYDLNCIVLKISDNKTTAAEIQRIPTTGARTLKLFHSVNGIILIIGNVIDYSENDFTQIFRFNELEMQFHLLRIVPSLGCSSAAGVVFGADSMIILAHKRAPLQILKYEKEFDNYYFYQSLELDSKVISVSVFYIKDFGISDAYLCVVTENNHYYIYTYRYIQGWVEVSSAESDGVKSLIPFTLNESPYLFVGSSEISFLLRIVKRGSD